MADHSSAAHAEATARAAKDAADRLKIELTRTQQTVLALEGKVKRLESRVATLENGR